jgi:CMP-N-acetylneuraminic acid synthetase
MINLLKQALETVLNHKQMGKLSPSDFNTSLAKNIWNIYVNIFANMMKLSYRKMRFQDTPNYADESGSFIMNEKGVFERPKGKFNAQEWFMISTKKKLKLKPKKK